MSIPFAERPVPVRLENPAGLGLLQIAGQVHSPNLGGCSRRAMDGGEGVADGRLRSRLFGVIVPADRGGQGDTRTVAE